MLVLLKSVGGRDYTIHGLRSSFATWAAERTNFASEIREACLAHQVGGEAERAYRRGDFFNKRRQLMEAWARFCSSPSAPTGAVVPIWGVA